MDPINYQTQVQTPFQAALQGYQAGAAIRNDQQQQTLQAQQQAAAQQQQQLLSSLASNPNATAQDYARVMTAIPSIAEPLQKAWSTKNEAQQQSLISDLSQWGAAIKNGQPQIASTQMQARADAMEQAAGGPTPESQAMRANAQAVDAHPEFALGVINAKLAAHPDGAKVAGVLATLGKEQRDQEMQPDLVRKGNAEATSAVVAANNAPAKAALESRNIESQIRERADRLSLDQDKLTSDVQMKLAELGQKNGELPEYVAKGVTDSAADSIASDQSATQMLGLADRIDQQAAALGSGVTAKAGELWKRTFGDQNELTRIRTEYSRIVTPAAMAAYKKVASGSTSDRDIDTAMTGVPSDTSDPATMASFLRGAAKLQVYDSVLNNAKSEWLGAVKHLGKTSKDIEVDGVKVPAGATFKQFTDTFVAGKVKEQLAAKGLQQVQSRSYMRFANPQAQPGPAAPAGLGSGTFGIPGAQ